MACKCNQNIKLTIVACLGLFLGLCGGVLYAIFPRLFHDAIIKQTVIKSSNEKVYDAWKSPPVPVNFKMYFFNVTNPNDFKNNNNTKPILQEVGPYVFKEKRTKTNIEFEDDGEFVWYRNKKAYEFDYDASVGSLDDRITTINIPFIGIAKLVDGLPLLFKTAANLVITYYHEDIFTTRNVSELGFDGWKIPMVDLVQKHTGMEILPNATFGLFLESKTSDDGLFEIYSGENNPEKFTIINKWNNKTSLPYWNSPYCNMINGTDGSQFPPFVEIKNRLYTYSTDLCRSLHLVYEKDTEHFDIKTYRFNTPDDLFADPATHDANKCYCTKKPCFGKGLLDISKCKKGAPVVMSPPHFYQSDPKYLEAVEGLHPVKSKHETFLDVEPNTGTVLNAAKRVQINIHLEPAPEIKNHATFPETIFPVVWVEQSASIDEESAKKFKDAVFKPKEIVNAVVITLVVLGCLVLIIAVVFVVISYNKKTKTSKDLNGEVNYGMKHVPS